VLDYDRFLNTGWQESSEWSIYLHNFDTIKTFTKVQRLFSKGKT